jgi:alpha-beta hydrolase superfamily lysophospholipase
LSITNQRFRYEGADGTGLAGYRWCAAVEPRAVIQLAHGAGEHAMRYLEPLTPLIEAGYVVYGADHRGHGVTAGMAHLGDFGPGGPIAAVDDMAQLARLIREREPGLPLALLGHSMGAMFARIWLMDHSELIDALVLSGTAGPGPMRSDDLNADLSPRRTAYDWLTRDAAEVDKYMADPLCGIRFTPDSRAQFLGLRDRPLDPQGLARVREGLPVYIFVGDADPINDRLVRLRPLVDAFDAAGFAVTLKVYAGGRHEMLFEVNRGEVLADLKGWLDSGPRRARTGRSKAARAIGR